MFTWYVLHSKPLKEEPLWRELTTRGIEAYCPTIRAKPVNPRARKERPFFPGYIFVHADLELTGFSALQWLPYSQGLLSFGEEPASVADTLINAIRNQVDEVNSSNGETFRFRAGDQVQIQAGPFAGYEAIFDTRLRSTERVRVLLTLLENQRQVHLDVNVTQIRRA